MSEVGGYRQMCPHCGSIGIRRLGECSVCAHTVCEHCGATNYANGLRRPAHHECLKKDDGFKMIKFVR